MSETIDQQFIEYIVKALVGKPDQVKIERKIDERGVLLELYVDPEDLGRVIGRSGATAKSIRTLLRALGVKNDARYNLKIVDTNSGGEHQPAEPSAASTDSPVTDTSDTTTEPAAPATDDQAPMATEPAAPAADEPDEPVEEEQPTQEPESESEVDRHRREIDDLTRGLDI